MNKIRLLGYAILATGIAGIILSVSADELGLSLFGGKNGWGVMNTTGALSGCALLLVGLILSLRTSSSIEAEPAPTNITVIGSDIPLQASTIPTIISADHSNLSTGPRRTVIRIDVDTDNYDNFEGNTNDDQIDRPDNNRYY